MITTTWPAPVAKLAGLVANVRVLRLAALLATLYWTYFWLLHTIMGPLNIDDLYFSHTLWMVRQGMHPFTDFYSVHLPYYFDLYDRLLARSASDDLSFVYAVRLTGIGVVVAYAAMLASLAKKNFLYLLPFLMSFVEIGAMTAVRVDTIGLLLFNLGWFLLISGQSRARTAGAAFVAGLALFFSARAAVMAPAMAIACCGLAVRAKDYRALWWTIGAGMVVAALILSLFASDPPSFILMLRSVYLDTSHQSPLVPILDRVIVPQRAFLLAMIVSALVSAIAVYRRDRANDIAFTIIVACAAQIMLVFVDPSPFLYVYSWALIPVLAGLTLGFDHVRGWMRSSYMLGIAAASLALFGLSLTYLVVKGHSPPTNSTLRLTFDAPFAQGALATRSDAQLVQMAITGEGQQGLWNQLAVKSELCRRIRTPVLATWNASPICLRDARYDWLGWTWSDLAEGAGHASRRSEFERLFQSAPPDLVVWGSQYHTPPLTPWGRTLLRNYDVGEGFALRTKRLK